MNKADKQWSSKSDDFFPYASVPFVYWTGYFTSRPALKRYERYANNILQVTRQLNGFAQTNLRNTTFKLSKRDKHRSDLLIENCIIQGEAMGLAQHHDAVSGTEKQHVLRAYLLR